VVGCVVVRDRAIISTGYNGFPEGVEDTPERYNNRELKYRYTVHAEQNAVYNAAKRGVALDGAQMFVNGLPCCHECAKAVIQSGISKVWMRHGPMLDKWRESWADTQVLFTEAGVEYECVEVSDGLPAGPHRES
jgi:dCMP deaminase